MANNRIPRNAKRIYITWKIDTTGNKSGDRATVERIEGKWIETTESGKQFFMPLVLLRNADAVQVDKIETDEPNNRKDVLLSDIGTQVYIIDGASRTDKAAQALITALCNSGRITGELAERARNDRPTMDKIKRNLLHVQMEERETETGMRWTFYTESGVYMDIPAYSRNYIRADKQGNLYPTEAPTTPETVTDGETTTSTEKEPQSATETQKKTIKTGERLYSHPHRHMVIVEGLQGELVRVIYKGRLYLVCYSDLYTDESETTPAMLPQAAESAEKTADDTTPTAGDTEPQEATQTAGTTTSRKSITTPTEGTQEAPQTAGTSEGAETTTPPHTEPPRAAEDATTGHAAGSSITPGNHTTGAGSYITPANQEPGTAAGDHTKPGHAAGKSITGAGKNITTPRHACENAPERTERAQAGQIHTEHTKSPPRGKTRAAPGHRENREISAFSDLLGKTRSEKSKLST